MTTGHRRWSSARRSDRGQCSEKPWLNADWYSSQQTDMPDLRSQFGG
jgi:hypothetical protein